MAKVVTRQKKAKIKPAVREFMGDVVRGYGKSAQRPVANRALENLRCEFPTAQGALLEVVAHWDGDLEPLTRLAAFFELCSIEFNASVRRSEARSARQAEARS